MPDSCSLREAYEYSVLRQQENNFLQYALSQALFPASLLCAVPLITTVTKESNSFQVQPSFKFYKIYIHLWLHLWNTCSHMQGRSQKVSSNPQAQQSHHEYSCCDVTNIHNWNININTWDVLRAKTQTPVNQQSTHLIRDHEYS